MALDREPDEVAPELLRRRSMNGLDRLPAYGTFDPRRTYSADLRRLLTSIAPAERPGNRHGGRPGSGRTPTEPVPAPPHPAPAAVRPSITLPERLGSPRARRVQRDGRELPSSPKRRRRIPLQTSSRQDHFDFGTASNDPRLSPPKAPPPPSFRQSPTQVMVIQTAKRPRRSRRFWCRRPRP